MAEQGLIEEGIPQLRQGVNIWRSMGGELTLPYYLARLAEAYGQDGQVAEGLQVIAEALTLVQKNAERYYEAELYRLRGEFLLALARAEHGEHSARTAEAEACFQQALEIAQRQHAKSLELRASLSLGHLWYTQGKHGDVHRLLTEIYSWFTEGFDTPDLQAAQVLLQARAHTGESHG